MLEQEALLVDELHMSVGLRQRAASLARLTISICQRRPPARPSLASLQDLSLFLVGEKNVKHTTRPSGR
ncbi:hypothetical protein, partial [Achromobacter sp. GD03932]|uniref:hypothetical protein n=1 Tax=Achromobacter sp. GD03932 TaxID=2975407 RepID=UPI002448DB6C